MRKLAEDIINAQQAEIEQMQKWLKAHNKKSSVKLRSDPQKVRLI